MTTIVWRYLHDSETIGAQLVRLDLAPAGVYDTGEFIDDINTSGD